MSTNDVVEMFLEHLAGQGGEWTVSVTPDGHVHIEFHGNDDEGVEISWTE